MGPFNIVPLGTIVVSKHTLGFLLLCSVSVCSVYHDLRLPPCLCERSSILSVSFGVRKPAGTKTSVEALQTVTSKSDQLVNCRWSTGVGRLGPRHDTVSLLLQMPPPLCFSTSSSHSPGGLSYDELIRHHARDCTLRKPELVSLCHQLGVPANINVAKATLQSSLFAYYRN